MKSILNKKLSLLLVLIMIMSVIPITTVKANTETFKDEYGNEWAYESDNSIALGMKGSTLRVGPASSTLISGDVIIPSTINGKAVTSFGGTFTSSSMNCRGVTSLTIPASLMNIESMAFTGWSNLETVNFESGSNLRIIQRYAFGGCSKLSTITLPASVEEIGVFYTNPQKQTGYYIFNECSSLTSIQVEEDSNYFKSVDGVLYSKDGTTLYTYPPKKNETTYEIPASVETINDSAFATCLNLTDITLAPGSNLTTLGSNAFAHSRFITSFSEFPPTLVNFGSWVFGGTTWLKNKLTNDNPYLIINGVLVHAYYGLSIPTTVTFPEGIMTINTNVFSNGTFTGNTSLTIPASVTKIGYYALSGYDKLANITFAEDSNLEMIDKYAFNGCNSITTLNLPENLTTIDDYAFNGCNSITTLILPKKLTTIGGGAFSYMSGLKSIAIPDSVTTIGDRILYSDIALEYIYTDNETVKNAELHESWNTYNYSFEPYDNYSKEAMSGDVSIEGIVKYGETLSAVTTNITNSDPGTYSYAWYRVNTVTGEESVTLGIDDTYTITADDIGYKLKLKVSSANCKGSLIAITGDIPKMDCPEANIPVMGVVDNTDKTFTFTGVAEVLYEYSIDNGSTWTDIPTIIGSEEINITRMITIGNLAIMEGHFKLRAKETTLYSASAWITNDEPYTASLVGNVQITGTMKYNETLTVNTTDCPSNAELTFTWFRSGSTTPIKTGISNNYTTVAEDIGKTISVEVTANGYTGNLADSTDVVVTKADAVITIAYDKGIYYKTYGDEDFILDGITNNVNGTVTFINSQPEAFTISPDGKVHIKSVANGTFEVRLPETDCYTAAESKYIKVSVKKASSVSIGLSNLNQYSNAITAPTVTMLPYSKAAYDKIRLEYGVVTGSSIVWSENLPSVEGNYKVRAILTMEDANLDNNINLWSTIISDKQDFVITKYNEQSGGGSTGNPGSGSSDSNSQVTGNDGGSTTESSTLNNSDGSTTTKTTTVNNDGSKSVKETTETSVTNRDGSSKTTESTKEIITTANGTSVTITSNTVTNTNTDGSSSKQLNISMDSDTITASKSVKTDKNGNITSSTATITVGNSKMSISKDTATVAVDIPQDILHAIADSNSATDVTIKITSDITKNAIINSSTKSVTVTVNVPTSENVIVNGAYLSKDVASMATKYKKDLTIKVENKSGDNYTVKIATKDLSGIKKDLNLSLNISSYKEIATENVKLANTIKDVLKSNSTDIQVVSFSDDKTLETGITLSYDVSDIKGIKAGDKVYIYRYNSKSNKLEEVANNTVKVSKDGTITTSTIKGGEFVVSADKLSGKNVTTLVDTVTANAAKTTLKAGSKTSIKVSLPDDIIKVTSFNKKSNPVGQEEAKVTFKVSDVSIAKIDSKGNVTAKKAGKVNVTVNIKLENGQKKTIKQTIQVK